MNEILEFQEALQRFRHFFTEQGHSADLFWVFREEVWPSSLSDAFVKNPPDSENESLAGKVFAEGRARGLVEIKALVPPVIKSQRPSGSRSFRTSKFKVGIRE